MKSLFCNYALSIILFIFLFDLSSCGINRYGIYKSRLIHDTNTSTTATNIFPFRLCIGTRDSQYVMMEDIIMIKYNCYKEVPFYDFNRNLGPKVFRKKCVSQNCENIDLIKFSNRQYDSLARLGIDRLIDIYFVNGVSKESYESGREKLTLNFLISLVILFDNEYQIWDGGAMDDNYHIAKFPTNRRILEKRGANHYMRQKTER